jgi:hypothetical protein
LQQLDFHKLSQLYRETCNHLDLLNLKETIESASDTSNLLNVALEDVLFKFTKVREEELVLADKLKNTLRQTREALASNFDPQDPKFITLREELERLFKQKKLSEVSQEDMTRQHWRTQRHPRSGQRTQPAKQPAACQVPGRREIHAHSQAPARAWRALANRAPPV